MATRYSPFVENKNSLVLAYDAGSRRSISGMAVKNISPVLTSWTTRRSTIVETTEVEPPFRGEKVWKLTMDPDTHANTLHRWDNANVIGTLGNGYYRYYFWYRGKADNPSGSVLSADISDSTRNVTNLTLTAETWQMVDLWDDGGSGYNAGNFFDFFPSPNDTGLTFYMSGINIIRANTDTVGNLHILDYYPNKTPVPNSGTRNAQILDLSGNGNHGTLNGPPIYTPNSGGTLIMNSENYNSSINVTNRVTLDAQEEWTVEFVVIPKDDRTTGSTTTTRLKLFDGNNSSRWYFEWENRLLVTNSTGGSFFFATGWAPALVRNEIAHIAFYNSGGTCQLRINDVEVNTTFSTLGLFDIDSIGEQQNSFSHADWKYIRIYNKRLSDTQLTRNWNTANRRYGIS